MQTLYLARSLWAEAVRGEKRATIRWGERRISPGPMRYAREDDPSQTLTVLVTRVSDMPLRRVAEYLGRKADWPHPVLLAGMQAHYPEIGLDDEVQVIEHLTPRETAARDER